MTNFTATQTQLLADATECVLVRQMYVLRGLGQVHPTTDHALINAALAAQDLALTAGVPAEAIEQAAKAADTQALSLTWGV